jgi:hypothetical protein
MAELEELQAKNLRLEIANEVLREELNQLKAEHDTILRTIIKALQVIDLWPIHEGNNVIGKVMKAVKSIMVDSMLNSKSLEDKFSFIQDIYPLCEKYKDFQL